MKLRIIRWQDFPNLYPEERSYRIQIKKWWGWKDLALKDAGILYEGRPCYVYVIDTLEEAEQLAIEYIERKRGYIILTTYK